MIFYSIKWQFEKPKLLQQDKVLWKWLTAMCSGDKPMSGHKVTEKPKSFYDKLKITHKNTFRDKVTKDYL
jgi:hypothetical protein